MIRHVAHRGNVINKGDMGSTTGNLLNVGIELGRGEGRFVHLCCISIVFVLNDVQQQVQFEHHAMSQVQAGDSRPHVEEYFSLGCIVNKPRPHVPLCTALIMLDYLKTAAS